MAAGSGSTIAEVCNKIRPGCCRDGAAGELSRGVQDLRFKPRTGLHPSCVRSIYRGSLESSLRVLLYEARDKKTVFERLHTGESALPVCIPISNTGKVPIYAILLFGGTVSVSPIGGGVTVGKTIKLRAIPRIGVLVTQLR